MKSVSIIGLNTWGRALARYLKQFGYDVKGSTRTYEKVESARLQELEAYQLELTPEINASPEDINALFNVDALVINIPPSRYFFHNHDYVKSIQNIINEALLHTVSHIIFISSTTILGSQPGILNETTLPKPYNEVTHALSQIESMLNQLDTIHCDILRLGKFIDPNLIPHHSTKDDILSSLNLIHAEDCCRAVYLLLKMPCGRRLYHLVAPTLQIQYFLNHHASLEDRQQAAQQIIEGTKICQELGFVYQNPEIMT
ncbi:hypothetical protein A6A19_03560 [Actinobacillus delphinicola]|uniref:NAD-dependent epimerase/dehydratase family protein n=1 Tax=Actinobacillus delphinicola TaxID=51161 RepID=UPI002442080D|nr:NAD-dependent epimerase/dehydratase family protein [Actinobacillus delphinicola]MDG6897100.1 hypothetical protein [Actinobacillus delphinicola]